MTPLLADKIADLRVKSFENAPSGHLAAGMLAVEIISRFICSPRRVVP
jgi:hypothetical protein